MDGPVLQLAVVAASIIVTLPSFEASPTDCSPVGVLRDLMLVRLYGRAPSGGPVLLAEEVAAGREGARDTLQFDLGGRSWEVWATAVDSAGNESCPSDLIHVEPLGAPAFGSDRSQWFDLAGRRVSRPTAPGVYWRRDSAGRSRKVFMVR